MLGKASGRELEHLLEHLRGCRDRAGKAHVAASWVDVPFRHIRHDRSHQRVSQPSSYLPGFVPDEVVVFAQHHVRPVLLGAASWDDHRGSAGR